MSNCRFYLLPLIVSFLEGASPAKPTSSLAYLPPAPQVILDKKGVEEQRKQSAAFFRWIDPQKATNAPRLQVHLPDFSEQVHYLVDEKNFTHLPRTSILRMPTEGPALLFFKSQKETQKKTFIAPEKFIQAHQRLFERIEADNGRAPAITQESKEKIFVLYAFGKIVIPQK